MDLMKELAIVATKHKEVTGKWDDLVRRADLRGRRVRITVLDEPRKKGPVDPWVEALEELGRTGSDGPADVDTSRDSIYAGTIDDTR